MRKVVNAELKSRQIKPGTILSISEEGMKKVSCRNGIIKLQELNISYDHRVSMNEIQEISIIKEGDIFPLFSKDKLQYFTHIIEDASKHNLYWQSQLEESVRVNLPWLRDAMSNTIIKRMIKLSNKKSREELIAYVVICLNKFTNSDVISFYYEDEDEQKKFTKAQGLIYLKIYNISAKSNYSIKSLTLDVLGQLNQLKESNKSLGIDTIYNTSETPTVEITLQNPDKLQTNVFYPATDIKFVIAQDNKSIDCVTTKTREAEMLFSKLQEYFPILEKEQSIFELLGSIVLNTEEEVQKLNIWNETTTQYHNNKTIQQLFEDQVEKIPNNIAVVYEDLKLTYKQLNEKVNKLANYLKEKGIFENTLVAVALKRSARMVISLLAILKAGGVYLPLDPEYPDERLSYILEDTKAEFLVTAFKSVPFLNNYHGKVIDLDHDQDAIIASSSDNLKSPCLPAELVYVIYTSGNYRKT